MKASVFVGTSVDGFIARHNGDFDFLPEGGGEPHGYDEFIATVDVLVIGRNTFDKVLTLDTWPYHDMRVVVLSNRAIDTSAIAGARVERMCGPPPAIVSRWPGRAPNMPISTAVSPCSITVTACRRSTSIRAS